MHFLIYKITNTLNNKIYIGSHKTKKLDDGYMGSGSLIRKSIKKYGIENFKKEILIECNSVEEMMEKEKSMVNSEFLSRSDVYNLLPGGSWGYYKINESGLNMYPTLKENSLKALEKGRIAIQKKLSDPEWKKRWIKAVSEGLKNSTKPRSFLGHHHRPETKLKISEKMKISIRGPVNFSYGTCWIYSEELKHTGRIKKSQLDEFIKQGWKLGRKMTGYQNTKLM